MGNKEGRGGTKKHLGVIVHEYLYSYLYSMFPELQIPAAMDSSTHPQTDFPDSLTSSMFSFCIFYLVSVENLVTKSLLKSIRRLEKWEVHLRRELFPQNCRENLVFGFQNREGRKN